jgi:ABC-2 type transport system permease protein
MRVFLILLGHSLKRVRVIVIATGALLTIFQMFVILIANSIQSSNTFQEMGAMIPGFARDMLGPAMAGFLSFKGFVCLDYYHMVVMSALIALAIAVATMPTSEIEIGFIDLILARPVARHLVITRSILVCVLIISAILGLMMAGTWVGLETLASRDAEWPSRTLIFSLAGNLGMLMLSWSGIAMAIGTASRRRGVAGAIAGLLALAAFLLDYVARAWKPAESAGWLSPFRYYAPFDLLMGTPLAAKNLFVLAAIAIAGFALAYVFFSRRDISH